MKTLPTLSVVALALGLIAAKSHTDSLRAPQAGLAAPAFAHVATTPKPDYFGSMLVVR